MFTPNVRIKSKTQFGFNAWQETDENDDIELSDGLGWGLLESPHGYGVTVIFFQTRFVFSLFKRYFVFD
ncbi:MAG: hypothetical protein ABJR05_14100 [Balneola sp.]